MPDDRSPTVAHMLVLIYNLHSIVDRSGPNMPPGFVDGVRNGTMADSVLNDTLRFAAETVRFVVTSPPHHPGRGAWMTNVWCGLIPGDLQRLEEVIVRVLDSWGPGQSRDMVWGELPPDFPCLVNDADHKALAWALRRLEEAYATTPARDPGKPSKAGSRRKSKDIEAQAITLLIGNPTLKKKEIAKIIGCNPKSLAPKRCPQLELCRRTMKADKEDLPRGRRDPATGAIEAWRAR